MADVLGVVLSLENEMTKRLTSETSLHKNPFWVLGVTIRDDRRRIVEQAEEKALVIDHDLCQKARSDLTNPRSRLSAEMAWLPGVAPRMAEKLIMSLVRFPDFVFSHTGLPSLSRANLMAATLEVVGEEETATSIAKLILEFVRLVETVDPGGVLRDINEERAISGFPEVRGVEVIEEEFAGRRKAYREVLKNLLDSMDPEKLVETIAFAVDEATESGEKQGPRLLDELVDAYEIEAQGFLVKESENIAELVRIARDAAPRGENAVARIIDKLDIVARNWDRIVRPIQLSMKPRGITHEPSQKVARELRGFAVDLFNDYEMTHQSTRMIELLREQFKELPEVAERLDEDREAIDGLRRKKHEREKQKAQWERDITFRAEVGVFFNKKELEISPKGVSLNGRGYPLESITRVRWGAVRHSVNGVPTGTEYTIGFGVRHSDEVVKLKDESIFTRFIECLWKAVCVRLMFEIVEKLQEGQSLCFGDITVADEAVTLVYPKLFGKDLEVRFGWDQVSAGSADGMFVIKSKPEAHTYGFTRFVDGVSGSASYISVWNTHILEWIVQNSINCGGRKLSDCIKE